MTRAAAIDIGTNSILLVVADRAADDTFTTVEEHLEITRIGKGVDQNGQLDDQAIGRSLAALRAFAKIIEAHDLDTPVKVVATSALRDVSDGERFIAPAEQILGTPIEIISGDREADLVLSGVATSFPRLKPGTIVFDVGGGSTEFIEVGPDNRRESLRSLRMGTVRLTERCITEDPPTTSELEQVRREIATQLGTLSIAADTVSHLIGVAGTLTTLVALRDAIAVYDSARINGAILSADDVAAVRDRCAAVDIHARREFAGLAPQRGDIIVAGAEIVLEVMRHFGLSEVTVCDRGVRFGLLAEACGTVDS